LLFYNCLIAATHEWNYTYKENYGEKALAVAHDYSHYYNKVTMTSITMLVLLLDGSAKKASIILKGLCV
jgi:hypothetical protein